MTESICAQARPAALTRRDFARCGRAVRYGMSALEEGGAFAKGPARGLTYRRRVRLALWRLILRIRHGLEGVEAHTSYATARGFAEILGLKRSATWAILKLLWKFSLIERATPKIRRGAAKSKSPTQGWSPVWWCPSHWRIGAVLAEFFATDAENGTKLADSPLDSHNRTSDSLTGVGSTPTSTLHPSPEAQEVQNLEGESSGGQSLSEPVSSIDGVYRSASPQSPVPAVRPLPPPDAVQQASQATQQAIQSMRFQDAGDPLHPEGADLGKVLSRRASPEVMARVRARELMDLAPDPAFEARRACVIAETKAEIVRETARAPTPLPLDPSEPKLSGLEAALADLARRMGLKPPDSPS